MMDVTRGAHGEVVIHIDGDFDAMAATRLSGWLVEVPHDDPLVIDFTHVRRCEPVGLATVAVKLAAHTTAPVTISHTVAKPSTLRGVFRCAESVCSDGSVMRCLAPTVNPSFGFASTTSTATESGCCSWCYPQRCADKPRGDVSPWRG